MKKVIGSVVVVLVSVLLAVIAPSGEDGDEIVRSLSPSTEMTNGENRSVRSEGILEKVPDRGIVIKTRVGFRMETESGMVSLTDTNNLPQ